MLTCSDDVLRRIAKLAYADDARTRRYLAALDAHMAGLLAAAGEAPAPRWWAAGRSLRDITCLADFQGLTERFPQISAWMIGRGALANPFLPARIKGIALTDDPLARIVAYHDALFAHFSEKQSGPGHILGHMKGIWLYLAGSFSDGGKLLKKIQKTHSIEGYGELMGTVFNTHCWQPPQTGGFS